MTDPQAFIFFGSSGSGKGTQAKLLIEYLEKKGEKAIYIETGEKIRHFLRHGTHTSLLTKDVIDHGGLLPAFIPIWLWTSIFIEKLTGKEHIVLDGLSRREHEAPILHDALKFYNRQNPSVIVLNVSNEECKRRLLSRNRSDDKVEEINKRLSWYEGEVVPTIEYFRRHDYFKVVDIDGEQGIEKVHAAIVSTISHDND